MYRAQLEIVLSGYEELSKADDELELAMYEIGFTRPILLWEGNTDLDAISLVEVVQDKVLSSLKLSSATVRIHAL